MLHNILIRHNYLFSNLLLCNSESPEMKKKGRQLKKSTIYGTGRFIFFCQVVGRSFLSHGRIQTAITHLRFRCFRQLTAGQTSNFIHREPITSRRAPPHYQSDQFPSPGSDRCLQGWLKIFLICHLGMWVFHSCLLVSTFSLSPPPVCVFHNCLPVSGRSLRSFMLLECTQFWLSSVQARFELVGDWFGFAIEINQDWSFVICAVSMIRKPN